MASTSSSSSSSLNLSSLSTGSPLQITGLASGLDTNSIIQKLMSIDQMPLTHIQQQQQGIQARDAALKSVQSALQSLASAAQALSSTSLFANSQTVTSTNSTIVAATAPAGVGAVVGGYQIAISQLATAAQKTFSYTSQAGTNTVTVGNGTTSQTYNLAAGATVQDIANAVNADNSGSVWAAVVSGNLVFSDRTTGAAGSFTVSDGANALTPVSSQAGQDAAYTVNGGSTQYSPSNTVTGAIPGVNLTLGGVTTAAGGPVTVTVGAPSVSTSAIQSAVQAFATSYNSVLSQISGQLSQTPVSSDPTQGTLYGDPELSSLLTNMRQAMYAGGSGLPAGMASMMDIGVSTGLASGSATPSQAAISGQLSVDVGTLTQVIQSNPGGVTAVLKSWSQSFTSLVNAVAQSGGSLDLRMQGDSSEISALGNQISTMQAALTDRQNQLTQQFAALESALSQNQSTASWLNSQLAALPVP